MKDEKGKVAATEEQQIKIVSEYFTKMLAPTENEKMYKTYQPKNMDIPFTREEIMKAAKSLRNGKSTGPDNPEIEYIKYAPIELHNEITKIFNSVSATGEEVTELILGILRPLQKPGKAKGPPANLRPIILLSVLRKILTICMIRRTWDRLQNHIPSEQAAYQPGRSTTEQLFAVKTLAASDFTLHLLLLDMSKAFDTVNRQYYSKN